ncbi:hypothetical protein COZ55_01905 [archaeon CG_4_8_14_3_um_filter_38_5]|nr:MAG: hypothetical protein COZ55_01905 [archaeon CG_4_8_14_3_um_filter_38_5]
MQFFKSLFEPGVVALIGASEKKGKVGNVIFNNLLKADVKVVPVNINTNHFGLFTKVYERVTDYEGSVDLAIIAIPARFVPSALKDCGEKGIKAVIIISAGFEEAGNNELSDEIRKICAGYNIEVLGPNCLGIINAKNKLNASFFEGMVPYEKIAFVSQSGALGVAVLDEIINSGNGLSKFLSVGNMLNTYFYEIVQFLEEDEDTDIICLYVEGLKKGKEFIRVMKHVKKPVIILKAGNTKSGSKAINSHTGSLAGSSRVYKGVFRQLRVFSADNISEMFSLAHLLMVNKKSEGNNVCIVTNAGGGGVLATDACETNGLNIPAIPLIVRKELNKFLPDSWSRNNPVDVLGDADSTRYSNVFKALNNKNFYNILLCILTPQGMTEPLKTAEALVNFAKKNKDKRVFACFMGERSVKEARECLHKNNILNFKEPYDFARLISKMVN